MPEKNPFIHDNDVDGDNDVHSKCLPDSKFLKLHNDGNDNDDDNKIDKHLCARKVQGP